MTHNWATSQNGDHFQLKTEVMSPDAPLKCCNLPEAKS